MATIESLIGLITDKPDEIAAMTIEQIVAQWKDCFDLEKKLLIAGKEATAEDEEENPSIEGAAQTTPKKTRTKKSPTSAAIKKQTDLANMLSELMSRQKQLEADLLADQSKPSTTIPS